MIVNSLTHFLLNILGAKRQGDPNDYGAKRPVGRNDKGPNVFGATRLRVEVVLGRKDLDSHCLPRYGGQIFHFMSTK